MFNSKAASEDSNCNITEPLDSNHPYHIFINYATSVNFVKLPFSTTSFSEIKDKLHQSENKC